jgi:tetratricopeptide (TPR) repeat protein
MLMQKATDNLRDKNYSQALPLLKKAHTIRATSFTTKWIGLLDLKSGNIEEAAQLLEQAAKMLPEDFEVRYNLCNAYIILKKKEDAKQVLYEMEGLRPDFNDPQNLRDQVAELN